MKIVFQKVLNWEGRPNAEEELSKRFMIAAKALDLQAIASSDLVEIEKFKPDLIVPLHFFIPKLFDAFTVGCMWNPTYAIERNESWDNIKSYDGYAVASEHQEQLVRYLKFKSPSPYLISELYPSTNKTIYNKPKSFKEAVYVGSNWDKRRHIELFKCASNISVYGPQKSWDELPDNIYRGEVPFDGSSVLKLYQAAGIGLALHHPEHNKEALPSMRPFEIAASGALMISDQNSFVKSVFNDSVLYLDSALEPKEISEQLTDFIEWIRKNPRKAQEMSHAAHAVFCNTFSLEVLLQNLVSDVTNFKTKSVQDCVPQAPSVEIIVRTDGSRSNRLIRALKSIEDQSYPNVVSRIVYFGPKEKLKDLQDYIIKNCHTLNIQFTQIEQRTDRATNFYTGLRAGTSTYVGFLDDDDILFHNHIELLIKCLRNYPDSVLAYGGSVRIWDDGLSPDNEEVRRLAYFHDVEGFSDRAFITSNSYILLRDAIPWHVLYQPIPEMEISEDRLFLEQLYLHKPHFVFSEKVTNAFTWNYKEKDNTVFLNNSNLYNFNPGEILKKRAATAMSYEVQHKGYSSKKSYNFIFEKIKLIFQSIFSLNK